MDKEKYNNYWKKKYNFYWNTFGRRFSHDEIGNLSWPENVDTITEENNNEKEIEKDNNNINNID